MSMSDVEAERVLAVLERTEVKLELLGCVPLGRDEGLCLELAAMSCEETLDVLDRQWCAWAGMQASHRRCGTAHACLLAATGN